LNKTAIITGATSGIGASFAKKLASQGYDLFITGRRIDIIQKLADKLSKKYKIKVKIIIAELSNNNHIEKLVRFIHKLKNIDILVNNAGFGLFEYFSEVPIDDCEKMIYVHCLAAIKLIHAVIPKMIKQGYGSIINVSSLAAVCPVKKDAVYSGTKSFLNTFSESLNMELGNKGIIIQSLCPGFTSTDFHKKIKINSEDMKKLRHFKWMSADEVVEYSLKCLRKNKVICIPGWRNRILVKLTSLLPKSLYYKIVQLFS